MYKTSTRNYESLKKSLVEYFARVPIDGTYIKNKKILQNAKGLLPDDVLVILTKKPFAVYIEHKEKLGENYKYVSKVIIAGDSNKKLDETLTIKNQKTVFIT